MNRKGPRTSKAKKGARPARVSGTPDPKPPSINVQSIQEKMRDSPVPGHRLLDDSSQHGSVNGFATPPVGATTPANGLMSQLEQLDPAADKFEMDADNDEEYNLWKTMTKKSRARVAVRYVILVYNMILYSSVAVERETQAFPCWQAAS